MNDVISIEVLKGGFVLHYPNIGGMPGNDVREIFVSPRKLNQKLKEVIDQLSLVPADTGKAD